MLLARDQRSFGNQRPHPYRDSNHSGAAQIVLHVMRQLVDPRLLRAIAGAMHIAGPAERRAESDQARALRNHQLGRVPARHIGGTQADIEDLAASQVLFPERLWLDQLRVKIGGIVDQHVETALLGLDLGEEAGDLGIVAVIADDRDAVAAQFADLGCGFGHCAGQHCSVPALGLSRRDSAASNIDGVAQLAQPARNARACAPAGSGYQRDLALAHPRSPCGCAAKSNWLVGTMSIRAKSMNMAQLCIMAARLASKRALSPTAL